MYSFWFHFRGISQWHSMEKTGQEHQDVVLQRPRVSTFDLNSFNVSQLRFIKLIAINLYRFL